MSNRLVSCPRTFPHKPSFHSSSDLDLHLPSGRISPPVQPSQDHTPPLAISPSPTVRAFAEVRGDDVPVCTMRMPEPAPAAEAPEVFERQPSHATPSLDASPDVQ